MRDYRFNRRRLTRPLLSTILRYIKLMPLARAGRVGAGEGSRVLRPSVRISGSFPLTKETFAPERVHAACTLVDIDNGSRRTISATSRDTVRVADRSIEWRDCRAPLPESDSFSQFRAWPRARDSAQTSGRIIVAPMVNNREHARLL